VHCRIPFGLKTAEGVERFESFVHDAADLCVRYGGSLSGEHGDGQARGPLLAKMYGDDLVAAFHEFKAIWDPDDRMNPGKSVDAESITANLRLGTDYEPPQLDTRFKYPNDDGDFVRATSRCVGVGKCRRMGGGTMCPSYMVTREEKHSTRGRARLLFELFRSGSTVEGWKEDAVREALDLCLACKGCKSDCPVNVDMATYKAEFLYHYYKRRVRPRAGYAMGLIYWWARLASKAPRLANWVSHKPGFAYFAKWLAGVAQERELPRFATQTLRGWFNKREARNENGPEVILWPDTFNNFWHPETGRAAVEVLEAAGYRVRLPDRMLCCGRPLYDYGMLDLARRQLRQIMSALGPDIDAGTPIVGLEPSCAATFRDELVEMFPDDDRARSLSERFYLLSEFLAQEAEHLDLPRLNRRAVVHGHCHQKAVMGLEADREILDRLGLDFEILTSGCCGMAGAFGFEKQNYDVSIKCGERVLLPAVREVDEDTLIIADGFSCRTQIEQATDREALHLAQVIRLGLAETEPRGKAEAAKSGVAAVGGSDVL
jgi:Fe-S oxidoreductase